jgi:hypothetical protein
VSPHFYTTDDELSRFMAELDAVRAELPKGAAPAAKRTY